MVYKLRFKKIIYNVAVGVGYKRTFTNEGSPQATTATTIAIKAYINICLAEATFSGLPAAVKN